MGNKDHQAGARGAQTRQKNCQEIGIGEAEDATQSTYVQDQARE